MTSATYQDKQRAGYAATKAVREGALVRASRCEGCGAEKRLSGHHEDYAKPLDVVWLCNSCHTTADHARRAREREERMKDHPRELLHVREAAQALDVTEATVRKHIQNGELPAVRLGPSGRYRVKRTDLEGFLQEVEPRVIGTGTVGRTEKRP